VLTAFGLLIVALVATACGLLGGYGGRCAATLQLRRRVADHDDELEALDRRVKRREGQAGAEKRDLQKSVEEAAAIELARLTMKNGGALPAAVVAPAEPQLRSRAHIARFASTRRSTPAPAPAPEE
jgi:hypothetical protein